MIEFVLNYILTLCTRCACHSTLSDILYSKNLQVFYVIPKIYEIVKFIAQLKLQLVGN